ncbi:MAG: metallophosphoesterase [Planctomycetaceae bacterium]
MPAHLLPVSRRQFLAGSASAIASLGHSNLSAAEPDVNRDSWFVLSDTHLLSSRSIQQHYSGNKAAMQARATLVATNFERAARQVTAFPERPAGLILNGDCVHVGGREEYELLARKFALLQTIPIHVTMGNHDHRDNFSHTFRDRADTDRVLLEDRHVSVLKSRHANLVLLDSLTMQHPDRPVKGPGKLEQEQLEWFASVLDSTSDKPAIVMFHHNVDPSAALRKRSGDQNVIVPSSDPFRGLTGGLQDTDKFLDLLTTRPHVKAVFCGHIHQFRIFNWRNLHFVSLPPVGYTFGPKEAVGWIRMLLQDGGITLELQTLDSKHAQQGKRVELSWS